MNNAVAIDDALHGEIVSEPFVAGPENIERARRALRTRKIADLEFAMCCQAELDGPGSKTQQDIAGAIGCAQSIVSDAVRALRKITNYLDSISGDLERADAYDAAMREVRAPRQVNPEATARGQESADRLREALTRPPVHVPGPTTEPAGLANSADEWNEAHPDAFPSAPLVPYGPQDAIEDWYQSLERIFDDLFNRIAKTDAAKQAIRSRITAMLERY
jgi:hypothetical protein